MPCYFVFMNIKGVTNLSMIRTLLNFFLVHSFVIVFIISFNAAGQVSGIVVDAQSGKPVNKASVFINNTSLGAITNEKGEFNLEGIAPGFAELVIYREGYSLFKSSLRIQIDKLFKLNLKLSQVDATTKPAKSKQDAEYKMNLQWFERALLGESANAALCRITYPKTMQLMRSGDMIEASSLEPLIIENNALGYKITCYMQEFKADVETVNFQGAIRFDTVATKEIEQKRMWERNRLIAYWGSSRHFFQTLVSRTSTQEGFLLFDQNKTPIKPESLVAEGKIPGYTKISFPGETIVTFQMESMQTGVTAKNPEQTSTLIPLGGIDATTDGILLNAKLVTWKGYLGQERMAEALPLNYVATASLENEKVDWKNFSLLREKVYLHTDRDYYYPRETIWLKAYLGYSMPVLRDTLSHTLYVEFISPDKAILNSKVYPIKNGVAWGEISLDDKLVPGQYYVRAYTNWMRNYGDSALFIKPIPVLKADENIEYEEPATGGNNSMLTITTNKNTYKGREAIEMQVQVKDENGNPAKANVSVSVSDAVTSIPISSSKITDPKSLGIGTFEVSNKYFDQVTYFMERGISFRGVVKDSRNIPTPASVQIIQGNMDNLINLETDESGEFLVTGLKFSDSLIFAFQPVNKKGKLLPKIELLPREIPALNFNYPLIPLHMRKDNAMQRIQNTYQSGGEKVTVLEEVQITGKAVATMDEKKDVRVYGAPDYVVPGDKLGGTIAGSNLLVGLQGKVPGLRVTESLDAGGFRTVRVQIRGASSLTGNTEPLILVDGVPFPDANSLISIDPSMVERIEVVTSASPQFGSRGSNGIIAIYLKTGYSARGETNKNFISYKIPGYSRIQPFISPDYSTSKDSQTPDFRTTIFWKPDVKTDDTGNVTVPFYAADLATRYRIVVEGVTEKGVPVRAVSYITVE